MTLFLDTEFNGFGGELISIALVSDGDANAKTRGRFNGTLEFYGVRTLPHDVHPWVAQHVLPFLNQMPESDASLQSRLIEFLTARLGEAVVADWPEDFIHLLRLLSIGPGRAYRFALDMKIVNASNLEPEMPHNALSDAKALRDWYGKSGLYDEVG